MSAPRYTIDERPAAVTVTVPAPRSALVIGFLLVWLAGWSLAGAWGVQNLWGETGPDPFAAVWLAAWAGAEFWALAALLWQIAGREILEIGAGRLTQRIQIAGFQRRREFEGAHLTHLRVAPPPASPQNAQLSWLPPLFGTGQGALAFDYSGLTYRVGDGLDEAGARELIAVVARRFPQLTTGR